jgi:glycosyltransferase involved in cell wall biosynthesis
VRKKRRRGEGPHLLEVDLRWPPETFLCTKLEGVAARGMRVTVASTRIADTQSRLSGVELVALPQRGAPGPRTVVVLWRALAFGVRSPRRLLRLLREVKLHPSAYRRRYGGLRGLLSLYLPIASLRPDVVHFEWNHSAAVFRPMFKVWACPVVMSCRGSHLSADPHLPGHEAFAALLPKLLQDAAAVHCVSESLERLVRGLGVPTTRVRVIRLGVDPSVFRPGGPRCPDNEKSLRVIVVGWPRWIKGFEWSLQAMRTLLDAGVPARLEMLGADPDAAVGEPAERDRIRYTVHDLGLKDRVQLRGALEPAHVAQRLRGSDVLLVPSLEEGIPNAAMEAMASGIPVVATDCGGVSEAITDGVEGLLVPTRDATAMAHALETLWREPALRARMGEAARRTATSRFTLERQLNEFLALYTELLRSRPRARSAIMDSQLGASASEPSRVDSSGTVRHGEDHGSLRVLSAGQLIWQQGLEHSIHAIRILVDGGVRCMYRIIGDGPHVQAIAFARHQLDLTQHVEIVRHPEREWLAEELRCTDVFVDPSVADMTTSTALRAASDRGLPIVSTARPAWPFDGSWSVVARRDPRAIAATLEGIARDRLARLESCP